jgi:hypothetical protein
MSTSAHGTVPGVSYSKPNRLARYGRGVPGAPITPVTDLAVGLPQHPNENRPEHPILLAVDQELGEGVALRVAPELSDPVGLLEVGSMRTWSSSARGAGPRASRRSRSRRSRSSSSGLTAGRLRRRSVTRLPACLSTYVLSRDRVPAQSDDLSLRSTGHDALVTGR